MRRRRTHRQAGLATVEFAIVATTFFMILFGVLEVSRALFVWNTITEATRRGARVAAVCDPADPAQIKQKAIMSTGGGTSVLNGLTAGNVTVSYFDAVDTDDDGLDDTWTGTGGAFPIDFVRVEISGYTHTLLIPFLMQTITVPPFSTTLPAESLGWNPDTDTRDCF